MHARLSASTSAMVDDSRAAILDAARKALGELRAVVSASRENTPPSKPRVLALDVAMAETINELEASGRPVETSGYTDGMPLSRLVNSALARILREASTNVLKHGDVGTVRIRMSLDHDAVGLEVRNPVSPESVRREPAQAGYGTTRMAERTRHFGGEFHSGYEQDDWFIAVRLPLR
jgi:signal transduction histidine kinase